MKTKYTIRYRLISVCEAVVEAESLRESHEIFNLFLQDLKPNDIYCVGHRVDIESITQGGNHEHVIHKQPSITRKAKTNRARLHRIEQKADFAADES